MRLSTSSSELSISEATGPEIPRAGVPLPERVPSRRMALRLLGGTFLSAAALLAGSEALLRTHGYPPAVLNDKNLWCIEREKAEKLSLRDVVLVGTSRMAIGFSLDAFRARYPHTGVEQLAILSSRPGAVLKDLATRSRFSGTLICDVPGDCIPARPETGDIAADWVKYYHEAWDPLHRVNRNILTSLQERFVTAGPTFGPNGILRSAVARGLIKPPSEHTRPDREVDLDASVVTPAELSSAERNLVKGIDAEHKEFEEYWKNGPWTANALEVREYCRLLRERGGRVVMVRFPTTGFLRGREEAFFPRGPFWEEFVRLTGGDAIHCDDVPAMRGLRCPDGSHLDARDKAAFTLALCDELERRGWLGGGMARR